MGWKAAVFVEGPSDGNFFRCYLERLGFAVVVGEKASEQPGTNEEVYVFYLDGGIGKLFNGEVRTEAKRQLNKSNMGLFVFDANGDAEKVREKFAEFKGNFPSSEKMELFLMPNNEEAGALERLLKQIAVREEVFDCMGCYKKCLHEKNLSEEEINRIPDEKAEIYAYCKVHGIKGKDKMVDYDDEQYWNLEHAALAPLRAFLMEHLGRA